MEKRREDIDKNIHKVKKKIPPSVTVGIREGIMYKMGFHVQFYLTFCLAEQIMKNISLVFGKNFSNRKFPLLP